jgi:hypothetical protein
MAGSDKRKEPNWREAESMSDAASRLLRVLDERAKKRKNSAGEDLGRRQIADQPPQMSPTGLADERADGASDGVQVSLKRRPQLTDSREDVAGGLVKGGGQTDLQCVRFSYGSKRAACPVSGSPLLPAERARNAPESEIE